MDMRNKADATSLHLAARHGHTEIARFLCLAGLNINIQDKVNINSILYFCFTENRFRIGWSNCLSISGT
jgi:ankyrin repeat protein